MTNLLGLNMFYKLQNSYSATAGNFAEYEIMVFGGDLLDRRLIHKSEKLNLVKG